MRAIGKDNIFYCMANKCWLPYKWQEECECIDERVDGQTNTKCGYFHRKWPTPLQYKEEYGDDWKGGVYYRFPTGSHDWRCADFEFALTEIRGVIGAEIVCACTHWGRPPLEWRGNNIIRAMGV